MEMKNKSQVEEEKITTADQATLVVLILLP